jgi:peptidoglycan/xylan/chitin deacetylase (PgdA/CDA1 family)
MIASIVRTQVPIPILMYHSITPHASLRFKTFTVAPETFEAQLAYLAEQSYTPITVSRFVAAMDGRGTLPNRPVVLTFDYGFADFYTTALPALRRQRFPATLYIATGYVGQTSRWLRSEGESSRPMLTWQQIAEVCADGIECGAHSHTHPKLDSISPAQARAEIQESAAQLEHHLKTEILSFCYPFGYYSPTVQRLVQEAGYTSACAVRRLVSSLDDDRFALSRLIVVHDLTLRQFAQLLSGQRGPGNRRSDRAKTYIWQLIRRVVSQRRF